MLHKETVQPRVLELLKKIENDPFFQSFSLAGGTALALQIGHRYSIDLDFFTVDDFESSVLTEILEQNYSFYQTLIAKNTLKGIIDEIHVEFISHKYPLINSLTQTEGVHLYSVQDIAAMKLNAISVNGTRVKDFIDLYFLTDQFSLKEILSFYSEKYKQKSPFHALKSMVWFEDVNIAEWPVLVKTPNLSWLTVTEKIQKEVQSLL